MSKAEDLANAFANQSYQISVLENLNEEYETRKVEFKTYDNVYFELKIPKFLREQDLIKIQSYINRQSKTSYKLLIKEELEKLEELKKELKQELNK